MLMGLEDVHCQLIADYIDWRYEARRLSMYDSLLWSLNFAFFFPPCFTTDVTFPLFRYDPDDVLLVTPRALNSNLHRLSHDLQTPLPPPRHPSPRDAAPHQYPEPRHRLIHEQNGQRWRRNQE